MSRVPWSKLDGNRDTAKGVKCWDDGNAFKASLKRTVQTLWTVISSVAAMTIGEPCFGNLLMIISYLPELDVPVKPIQVGRVKYFICSLCSYAQKPKSINCITK